MKPEDKAGSYSNYRSVELKELEEICGNKQVLRISTDDFIELELRLKKRNLATGGQTTLDCRVRSGVVARHAPVSLYDWTVPRFSSIAGKIGLMEKTIQSWPPSPLQTLCTNGLAKPWSLRQSSL